MEVPEFRAYRLVAVTFGVLCVLQVALNVYLRINYNERQLQTNCSIPQEQIELLTVINNLVKERDQLLAEKEATEGYFFCSSEKGCPKGWVAFGFSCYYKSLAKDTWSSARMDCMQRGADLIIVNTQEKQDFVRQLETRAWIGLTDKETEGVWKWVDGTLLISGFWNHGEPNNANGIENCVEVDGHLSDSRWNDVPCNFQWYWICERPSS